MPQGQAQPPRQTLATFGGGTPSARAKLNALVGAVNALKAGPNVPIQANQGNGFQIVARITGGNGTDGYTWVQVVLDGDGEWVTLPDGFTSTDCGVAYEVNGVSDVAPGSIVQMTRYQNQAGDYVYQFAFGEPAECALDTPYVVLGAGSASETAEVDTWDREAPPTSTLGVSVPLTTRTVYSPSGDQVLYYFYRLLTFDACGKLATITEETRVDVTDPQLCPDT